ncbi:MAG: tetratricopeptide repeat protein [Roseivirga sp.]|nr:tetratricopeptide repeat protein [Roseivirga sp.]
MICRAFYIVLISLSLSGTLLSSYPQETQEDKADSLISAASDARSSGEYDVSEAHYQQAIELYLSIEARYKAGVAYYNLARMYYSSYQDSLTLVADSQAIDLFSQLDSIPQLAMATNQLGNHMSGLGMNREAIEEYEKAIAASRSIGDSLSVGFYYNNLGLVLKDLGEYQKALTALYRSLELKEDYEGSDRSISSSLLNIGLVLDFLQKPEESLTFYGRAITYKSKAGDSLGIARTYANMAVIHKNQLRYDSAINLIGLSNDILRFYPDEEDLHYVNQTNLGNLFKRKGDFKAAEEYLQSALSIAQKMGDKDHVGDTYQSLGSLAFDQGDSHLCIEYNLKALELTKKTQSYGQMMEINSNLQEAYAHTAQYQKAHQSAILALQYRDSVYRMEQVKASEELQTRYETEKKEQQILFQEAELRQQASIILRNQAIITALILIALLSIGLFWSFRVRQKKQRALVKREHEIKLRDAELNAIIYSQEKERKRFATDLHDGFGQLISVLKLNLGRLTSNNARNIELRQAVYEQSEGVINDMYAELRNICFDLMPQTLVKRGLPLAVQEFAERINQTGDKVMEVMIFGMDERLTELQEVSLYRISQEWVNNILKYSDAEAITLQIIKDEDELTLTIEDDGKGFDPQLFYNGKGNGWRNISSRLNLLDGEFDLDSSPNTRGTMVTLNIAMKTAAVPTSTEEQITA